MTASATPTLRMTVQMNVDVVKAVSRLSSVNSLVGFCDAPSSAKKAVTTSSASAPR